jgi:hypothetical protein
VEGTEQGTFGAQVWRGGGELALIEGHETGDSQSTGEWGNC